MKAEEPGSRVPAEKYGMPIEYADRIVERHFEVLDEAAALEGAQIAHDIKRSLALRGALDRAAPTSAPAPAMPVQAIPAPDNPKPQDLRAQLGLR